MGIDGYPRWHDAFGDHWRRFGQGSGAEYDLGGGYVGPSPNITTSLGPSIYYDYANPNSPLSRTPLPSRPSRLGVRRRAMLASPVFTAGASGGSSISERLRMALIRDRASLESLHPEERRQALEDAECLARTSEDPVVRSGGSTARYGRDRSYY